MGIRQMACAHNNVIARFSQGVAGTYDKDVILFVLRDDSIIIGQLLHEGNIVSPQYVEETTGHQFLGYFYEYNKQLN